MKKLRVLLAVLAAATVVAWRASGAPASAQSPPPWGSRPNVVWLVAEDLSPSIPPFGDTTVETPALSRLAAEGVRYTHVFSPSGVCAPSRAALATGMYPTHISAQHMRTGPWYRGDAGEEAIAAAAQNMPPGLAPYEAVPPPEVKMHAEVLRAAGYYTFNNAKEDYQFRKPVTAWDESGPRAHWRNLPPDKPFFAVFNFEVTHESRIWTKAGDPLLVDEDLEVEVPPYLPQNEIARRDVRRMYSNVKEMDRAVGEILDQLEEDDLFEETIVFFYTDHGGPLPRQKRLLYDSGTRVPLVVRFPGKWRAGEVDGQLVSFVDFLPTLLSLAGVEPPAHLDGRAFLGKYAADEPRRYVHGAADRMDDLYDTIRSVRDRRFKYLRNLRPEEGYYLPLAYREQMPVMRELLRLRDAGELDAAQARWFRARKPAEELFDTANDPHELVDLAADPAYAEKLAELRAECGRWMAATGDPGRGPEGELVESIWPGRVQPVTASPVAESAGGEIALSSETAGASIGYQVRRREEPLARRWLLYTGPVALGRGQRLVAVAHRLGYRPSEPLVVAGPRGSTNDD